MFFPNCVEFIVRMYERAAHSIEEMSDLPLSLRSSLVQQSVSVGGALEVNTERKSRDGTRKRVYKLNDGKLIESVLMPYDDGRYTACISSQVGCAMACSFCATGQMGFSR